jgi:flavin reductase (DIM6/NTAB) family NADH-FMN oxidoreductase RutF
VTGADELRAAMRRFASGICVVTVEDEGRTLGLTVGSLVSLSLEPPLVGISIGLQSQLHEPLRRAGRFAVSILAGDQAHLAQHFARSVPPIALWEGVPSREGDLLEGALAWLRCRVDSEHAAGDHTIFVGAVESVELGRIAPPLVYIEGAYRPA